MRLDGPQQNTPTVDLQHTRSATSVMLQVKTNEHLKQDVQPVDRGPHVAHKITFFKE